MKKELVDWAKENSLDIEWVDRDDQMFKLGGLYYLVINQENKMTTFSDGRVLQLDEFESIFVGENMCDRVTFKFGDKWYYSDLKGIKVQGQVGDMDYKVELVPVLKELKFLGLSTEHYPHESFTYLGIHGEYELCHGTRLYESWCEKAKFLNIKALGLCEYHTLAGVVAFQTKCKEAGIKPIIGERITVNIKNNLGENYLFNVKLFCKNKEGWIDLLHINNYINIERVGGVPFDFFYERIKDGNLFIILENDTELEQLPLKFLQKDLYYQFDFSRWDNETKDIEMLKKYKKYLSHFDRTIQPTAGINFQFSLKPILLQDSYFLDSGDYVIQKVLNKIGDVGFKSHSKEHYLKSYHQTFASFYPVFEDENVCLHFFEKSIENAIYLGSCCNFEVKLKNQYLPKFALPIEWSDEEEYFLHLIGKGLERKIANIEDFHFERIEEELSVIKLGGFISYFLILHDIIDYCKQHDIWWGLGRGSAAGCFIAYLLDIVQINPFDYDLLFERFLNKGRVGGSMPDIDLDVQSSKRDEIKRYIETKYGVDRVCSIGTFQTFRIKLAFKDLSRFVSNADNFTMNYVSSMISELHNGRWSNADVNSLITDMLSNEALKEFMQKNPRVFEYLNLIYKQCKNASVHPAGIIITPQKEGETFNDWLPVKSVDGLIVSEWEGTTLDDIGFLKNDILGIQQLDKFKDIYEMILKLKGVKVTFDTIKLNDPKVFAYFQRGLNEDVFQFGATGLRAYCKELIPESIEDLTATVAIYRPGPMFMGTHQKYIRLKNGREDVEYAYKCEEITKNTYGLVVYQEQIIRICQVVGGFSLVEADNVRKAMGKMDPIAMKKYSEKFFEGAVAGGCRLEEAHNIWSLMEKFAEYGFNRSHAAVYAITGYFSQYYKVYYPLEFWAVSLKHSTQDNLQGRVAEINKSNDVKLLPVDINYSEADYKIVPESNSIYWSLSGIKFISDNVLNHIIEVRNQGGDFYSMSEFISRVQKKIVNKRVVVNLILSGAFDRISNITDRVDLRVGLLIDFYMLIGEDPVVQTLEYGGWKKYQWMLKQKELSNYGFVDFKEIFNDSIIAENYQYIDVVDITENESIRNEKVAVIGLYQEYVERKSKNGPFCQMTIDCNGELFYITMWNEEYMKFRKEIETGQGKIVIVTGTVVFDNHKKFNVLHCNKNSKLEIL